MKSYAELQKECIWLPYNADEKAFIEENKDKAIVDHAGTGYAHKKYRVVHNPNKLSTNELALFCDRGNLCFGYRCQGGLILVHTD
jgi:hypothetical protein